MLFGKFDISHAIELEQLKILRQFISQFQLNWWGEDYIVLSNDSRSMNEFFGHEKLRQPKTSISTQPF